MSISDENLAQGVAPHQGRHRKAEERTAGL